MTNPQDVVCKELADAEAARLAGNEGRARVCARRAAGIAAREWLAQNGIPLRTSSAYEALKTLYEAPTLAPDLRQAALHLIMQVSETFALPDGVDLIVEARKLCHQLS